MSRDAISRRSTIAALAGGGLAAAMFAGSQAAEAQGAPVDYSNHPLCGIWMGLANPPLLEDPQVYGPAVFAADGFVLLMFPITQVGPNGVQFNTPYVGTWEPYDEQIGHFTAVQLLSDAAGVQLGSVTVDGHPLVSNDGQSFIDDGSLVTVTIRDAAGATVAVVPPGITPRPVTAVRMAPGVSGFPGNSPGEGTPIS